MLIEENMNQQPSVNEVRIKSNNTEPGLEAGKRDSISYATLVY
jgi:hypothetical protein